MGLACGSQCSRTGEGVEAGGPPTLTVMTLNVQQYKSFPTDLAAGARRLRAITQQAVPPDLLCIQEGVEDEFDHLGSLCGVLGYIKLQSSAWIRLPMDPSSQITNQLYLRKESSWEVVGRGAEVISSKMLLVHEAYQWKPVYLPVRTAVWARLKPKKRASEDGPSIFVFNAHLSGGRYEDQCYLQRLAEERRRQPARVLGIFGRERGPQDVGIFVGDFNASANEATGGPTQTYFDKGIWPSGTVRADAKKQGLDEAAARAAFLDYMGAPFSAVKKEGWTFAYDEAAVGPTSAYGHLVDHMAVSDAARVPVLSAERIPTCRGAPGAGANEPVPITDHHAVKCTFDMAGVMTESSWYTGGPQPALSPEACIEAWAAEHARRRLEQEREVTAAKEQAATSSPSASQPGAGPRYQVVVRQAEGFLSVRVLAEPLPGAAIVGEIPSGQLAHCTDRRGDFVRVRWGELDGWVGTKNTTTAPVLATTVPAPTAPPAASGAGVPVTPGEAPASAEYWVVVRQADGHTTVRVFCEPKPGAAVVGEVPSGQGARCVDHFGDFVKIRHGAVEGWVGVRNTCTAADDTH